MKNRIKLFSLIFMATFALSTLTISCSDDDDETTPPVITCFSAGDHYSESNIVEKSGEIIIDFDVKTGNDGRLDSYFIEIHSHPEDPEEEEFLIIEKWFNDNQLFKGSRNFSVHEHIDIPDEAPLGEYHVEIAVRDEFGNIAQEETHIEIVENID
ncbi:DUF4625 domain-containing protein [Marinilabiliaceae bacterium ANBcel2]|nr:DUF4625 domain-containing protein [Marinilabiliaceae bacterium ANBcel2]